ncbi:molybdenum ABC transporter ATP-binding protein [Pandoraea fibrosis]|uniref:Molybdenum ABC transporter ATP-binding protein n=1 Tax=Pandoraea fibrosis TaxID=1891094 RepID=A0ABX6HR11_9BURK|nr:molybdenum ABC transporter ATP-binding protein [Pandoraea fibrosis]QHE93494.1 molybdenum ABC transporter ATP-binding protein [Pandoraea fibrosis]QHF12944.1 molybdenum ABC transporter ATP-binding protein [Pandoraea fibrosis]
MTVEVRLQHRFGDFRLDAEFAAGMGVTALFGPSGSGKSTVVNAVSGLLRPDTGRIVVGDDVLFDSMAGVALPTWRRRIGYVFQDSRLLPHLTVRQNLLFGRWLRRRDVAAAGTGAIALEHIVDVLNLGHLLSRRPGALSGGEKQRVGIGRALLSCPRMLLMDEPLASLDHARRLEVLDYLNRIRHELKLPVLYVTHSLDEVMRLADQVVLFKDGRTVSQGAPADVLNTHRDALDGASDTPGTVLETRIVAHDAHYGLTELAVNGSDTIRLRVPRASGEMGDACRILVRERDVAVATAPPVDTSVLNVLPARVITLRDLGDSVEVEAALTGDATGTTGTTLRARITRFSADQLQLTAGREVYLLIKSVALTR